MYIVSVAPIQKGVLREELSFFSRDTVLSGAVVSAPIRGRMVPALVLSSRDAREEKLDLKTAGFALKKLGTATPKLLFNADTMRALALLARHSVTSTGVILAQLSFSSLLTSPKTLAEPQQSVSETGGPAPEVLSLQAEHKERMQTYRSLTREAFARGRSILVIAPTLIEVERLRTELSRGIEDRVVIVSSTSSVRDLRRSWNRVVEHTEPILVIGTPPALTFPLAHIDLVIVERESARAYIARTRPRIDMRRAAELFAAAHNARLLLADFPLRAETYARKDLGTGDELTRAQVRTQSTAKVVLVDTRTKDVKKETRRSFSALQAETYETMRATLARGGTVAVYAARKGIAPLTVCNDCGTPITDPATGAPMVLHKTPKGNVFLSHRSGAVESADRSCAVCGGWNLVSLGIGIERVADEIKKRLPESTCVLFTADTVKTHAAAVRVMKHASNAKNTIIIGTERMVPYLTQTTLSVVASIDSVLSLGSWRADEHALGTLYALLEKSEEQLILETRLPQSRVVQSVASGSPIEYLREEIRDRKMYEYPPFATFIGLEWYGTEAECKARADEVKSTMHEFDLVGPLPPEAVEKNRFVERAVVRTDAGEWPSAELESALRSLSPNISITVDPDDIV